MRHRMGPRVVACALGGTESLTWDLAIDGDDSVGIWVDALEVAGRAGAEQPPAEGSVTLASGWHHLQVIVYNAEDSGWVSVTPAASAVFDEVRSRE